MKDDRSVFILRGGGWNLPPRFALVWWDNQAAPGFGHDDVGIRLFRISHTLQRLAEVNNER